MLQSCLGLGESGFTGLSGSSSVGLGSELEAFGSKAELTDVEAS